MSVPRHHAEWLSLIEAQGAFLSIEELLRVFPQGLDAHEPEHFNLLKIAYDEWSYEKFNLEIHRAWIDWVLQNTLEFPAELLHSRQQIAPSLTVKMAQYGESLTPDVVLVEPDTGQPQLLIKIVPFDQGLEKSYKKSRWTASPATRMLELLRGTNINLGLVTNGEQWMLVYAPQGQSSSFISWYSHLWIEEKVTLRAFRSLLGVRRFFAVEAEETLTALFQNSKDSQKEVTDQLGKQVLKAVEVLVQKIDKLDQDRGLLRDVSEEKLYESALVVMMRLVFLFCAEEKGLLLAGNSLYDKSYAVSTIREELRTQADSYGEEILERRYDAWCRLLALFRGVHGGIDHHLLKLPAYGGNLFDPNRFPFLEGDDQPLQVDNRTVLHLLEALQILQDKLPGGKSEPRRLSFKGLDVEQIGHIYEGLLDHTAVRSHKAVLGIVGTKNKEPELDLTELEAKYAEGIDSLVKYLKKVTGRGISPLKKALNVDHLANETKGNADLCAYFFLRANQLIQTNGHLGLVATNTIAQGDTREVGLDQIVQPPVLAGKPTKSASTIYRGVPSRKWEGSASLEVAYAWLRRGQWHGEYLLDDKNVTGITPYLTIPGKAVGKPKKLAANQSKSFIGSYVLGMGFILTLEEAQALIEKDPRNKDVLFPYLNGQDLNSNPDQSPSRWVINFHDWALDEEHDDPKKLKGRPYAADYPDCLAIIEEKVKPERTRLNDKGKFALRKPLPQKWWIYADKRPALYEAIAGRDRVLVRAQVSRTHALVFTGTNQVISMMCVVLTFKGWDEYALLQSNLHEIWVNKYSSSLKKDQRYTPSDCFETFPFPESTTNLETIGETYYNHRQTIMQTRQEGLTKTYNRFHDPAETSEDIIKLRQLHVEMDYAVAQAYDWDDLIPPAPITKGGLDHGFHETKQGLRYTISEPIRREILDRLLQLNFDRYAEEVAQGLHDKKKGKSKKKKGKKASGQGSLF